MEGRQFEGSRGLIKVRPSVTGVSVCYHAVMTEPETQLRWEPLRIQAFYLELGEDLISNPASGSRFNGVELKIKKHFFTY